MTAPAPLPSSTPPPHLASRALPILLKRLANSSNNEASADLPTLRSAIKALVTLRLSPTPLTSSLSSPATLLPLSIISTLSIQELDHPLLLDTILAYPDYPSTLHEILDRVFAHPSKGIDLLEDIRATLLPSLLERLKLHPGAQTLRVVSYTLLCLLRAHEELLGLWLSEADFILPALRDAYSSLSISSSTGSSPSKEEEIECKSNVLLICRALESSVGGVAKEGMRRLIHGSPSRRGSGSLETATTMPQGATKKFLVGNTLGQDFDLIFSPASHAGGRDGSSGPLEVIGVLETMRDSAAREDPRLESLLPLFPTLPPHLLSSALDHSAFASASDPVSVLTDNILHGGTSLPLDLSDLKEAISHMTHDQASIAPTPSLLAAPSTTHRANIFDNADLDISRLRLGKDESNVPTLGTAIPDHLRESILRLVESQKAEAEAEARAVAEAWGTKYVPPEERGYSYNDEDDDDEDEEGGPKLKVRREGDESGEDEEDGEHVVEPIRDPRKIGAATGPGSLDIDFQTYLEQKYLAEPRIFDRDAATRRSNARRELREATGMDDGQLEGWRIMLERNPHKEAILARHTFVPKAPSIKVPLSNDGGSTRGGGGGGSGPISEIGSSRSSQSGRGRGGANGGRGRGRGGASAGGGGSRTPSEVGTHISGSSRGGGGGGGGRGRGESKGNRGHSNAARTRGHDRKMAKMGMGA